MLWEKMSITTANYVRSTVTGRTLHILLSMTKRVPSLCELPWGHERLETFDAKARPGEFAGMPSRGKLRCSDLV